MATYLLGAIVRLWTRLAKGGIDKWERHRYRSIASASAPLHGEVLSPEDQELVAAHHEILIEWRTAEQPVVPTVRRRHVYRPPSARQQARMRARALAPVQAFTDDPLTAPIPVPLAPAVIANSVPVSPAPWNPEGPSAVFSRDWINKILADHEAGTR